MCTKQRNKNIKFPEQTLMKWRCDLTDKEFKRVDTKILTEVRRTMYEESKNLNTDIKNIRKYQTKITEL